MFIATFPPLFGCGARSELRVPVPLPEIAAGATFTCIRFATGLVRCWGENHNAQLGDGTVTSRAFAGDVMGITNATQLVSIGFQTCVRLADSTARCWGSFDGSDHPLPIAIPTLGVDEDLQFAVGAQCIRLRDGRVQCRGNPFSGVFGFDPGTRREDVLPPSIVAGVRDVVDLSCRGDACFAVLANGTARAWGWLDVAPRRNAPLGPTLGGLDGFVRIVSAGGSEFCGFLADHTVRCSRIVNDPTWGLHAIRGLVDPGLTDVIDVALGGAFACAIVESGHVYCWGENRYGQLGDGTTVSRETPVRVGGLEHVHSISAGSAHVCAVLDDRRVACWGHGNDGQLGNHEYFDRSVPVFADIGTEPRGPTLRIEPDAAPPTAPRACLPNERAAYAPGCSAERSTPTCRVTERWTRTICDCNGNTVVTDTWPPEVPYAGVFSCRSAPNVGDPVQCGPSTPIEGDACTAADRDGGTMCSETALEGDEGFTACGSFCTCDTSLHWRCDPYRCVDPGIAVRCAPSGSVFRCNAE